MRQHDHRRILTGDDRIDVSHARVDAVDLAHQIPRPVDPVDRHLVHEQPRHLREVRLLGVDRVRARHRSALADDAHEVHRPDEPRIDVAAHVAVAGNVAPHLHDHEPHAAPFAGFGDRPSLGQRGGERLLTQHVLAALHGELHQRGMAARPSRDVDAVQRLALEHVGHVGIHALHAELARARFRSAAILVAHRDQRCVGRRLPGRNMPR